MNRHLPAKAPWNPTRNKRFGVGWIVSIMLSFMVFTTALTGCTPKEKEAPCLPEVFSTKAAMTLSKELKAECSISRSGPGLWAVEFTAPATLQGIGLGFQRSEEGSMDITATYLGLSFKLPEAAMPAQNALKSMIEGLEMCIGEREMPVAEANGQRVFHGVTASGEEFLLGLSAEDNSFQTFDVDKQDLKVSFTDFTPGTLSTADTSVTGGSEGTTVTTVGGEISAGEGKADPAAAKPKS